MLLWTAGRPTVDPVPAAAAIPELLVLAPADDSEAAAFAALAGARWQPIAGAADAPAALARLLDG